MFDSRIPLLDEREPASLIVLMFPYNMFCRMLVLTNNRTAKNTENTSKTAVNNVKGVTWNGGSAWAHNPSMLKLMH